MKCCILEPPFVGLYQFKTKIKATYFISKKYPMAKKHETMFKLEDKIESSVSKIDVIKNLIFGETIQAYDSEFEELKKDILKKKKVLEDLIEEIRTELNTSLDSVSTDVNIRITELEKNLEGKIEDVGEDTVNKKLLGKLLVELGEKIGSK